MTNLTRRGFLGLLVAGVAGVVAVKPGDLLRAAQGRPIRRTAHHVFRDLSVEFTRDFADALRRPLELVKAEPDEQMTIGRRGLSHQLSVEVEQDQFDDYKTLDEVRQRVLLPAAASMASMVNEDGYTRCGELPVYGLFGQRVKIWRSTDTVAGVSTRVISSYAYHIERDEFVPMMRFDVLVG